MKIKNINGTSDNTCNCGSWLKHWQKFSGQSITRCPVDNCKERMEVGAHVQKDDASDWYIFPLCNAHNGKKGESLEVNNYYKLVSANVSKTCGRR
jgi:hypothetical protein